MAVMWMAAFADVPAPDLAAAVEFWTAATGTSELPAVGVHQQYVPFAGFGEDPYLYVQRVDRPAGAAGWHPDIYVDDFGETVATAIANGAATVRAVPGLVTMASPAGQPFCLVAHEHEQRRPEPRGWPGGQHSLLDQLCLDLPAAVLEQEAQFWTQLTRWPARPSDLAEFALLERTERSPLRILLQRLGDSDDGPPRAHLDFSCSDVEAERARHEELGATTIRVTSGWITLRDPVGLEYCITRRDPWQSMYT